MRRSRDALLVALLALGLASASQGQDQRETTAEKTRLKAVWGSAKPQRSKLRKAMFLADGKHALCAFDSEIVLWDVDQGRAARKLLKDGDPDGFSWFNVDAFTPDGRLAILSTLPDAKDPPHGPRHVVWDLEKRTVIAMLEPGVRVLKQGVVEGVPIDATIWAITSDSRTAMAGGTGRIATYDLQTGRRVDREVPSPDGDRIEELALAPDARRALRRVETRLGRPFVGVWDSKKGILPGFEIGLEAEAMAAKWDQVLMSPDATLALASGLTGLKAWDLEKEALLWEDERPRFFSEVPRSPMSIAVTSSWTHVLAYMHLESTDRLVLRSLPAGRELKRFEVPATPAVKLALSPDAKRAISGGRDGLVHVWDLETGKEIRFELHASSVDVIAPSPDGKLVLTAGRRGTLELCDLTDDGEVIPIASAHEAVVTAATISSDGKTFLASSGDDRVGLRQLATGRTIWSRPWKTATAIAFSHDGKEAFVSGSDGLRRIDVETGRELSTTYEAEASSARSLAILPDGKRLVTVNHRGLALWDTITMKSLGVQACRVGLSAVSSDGSRVFVVTSDRSLELWKSDTLERVQTIDPTEGTTIALAFSPDGKLVLQAEDDGSMSSSTVRVWFPEGGFAIAKLEIPTKFGRVRSLAFLPNGREFVVGTETGEVMRVELLVTAPGAR